MDVVRIAQWSVGRAPIVLVIAMNIAELGGIRTLTFIYCETGKEDNMEMKTTENGTIIRL